MQYLIILAIGVLALALACFLMHRRIDELEIDLEMAFEVISRQTEVLTKHTERFEELEKADKEVLDTFAEFKERFDDVMTEAEKQVEEEIKWNTGLNNILNFCLDDAFNAGGGKK